MTVSVMWLFLTMPWVGLQCVIVVFPDHSHLLSGDTQTNPFRKAKLWYQKVSDGFIMEMNTHT